MHVGVRGAFAAVIVLGALLATGCSSSDATEATTATPTAEVAESSSPSPTPKATRTPPPDTDGDGVPDSLDDFPEDPTRSEQLYYASGDPVVEGYPLVVDTSQLDRRVATWLESTPQVVALAPGVYAGYNPAVTDLSIYLETNVADGDCAVRELYGFGGGSCWTGVLASPAEPVQ